MAAPTAVGTLNNLGNAWQWEGIAGTGAAAVVIQTDDISRMDTFMFGSTAGAMQVYASLDDANYYGPLSLDDLGATTSTPVTVTAANRMYRLRGCFRYIQVQQSGATAVANAVMLAAKQGIPNR